MVTITSIEARESRHRHGEIDREVRLIPWREIWSSLLLAKIRGHTGIVKLFFEVLLEESLFDDQGAWWGENHVSPRYANDKLAA